jgi:hypothetical protein
MIDYKETVLWTPEEGILKSTASWPQPIPVGSFQRTSDGKWYQRKEGQYGWVFADPNNPNLKRIQTEMLLLGIPT